MTNKFKIYKELNLKSIAQEIEQFWQQNNIFLESINQRPEENPFVFYEGPPSANGMPGIHHAMARTIKDIFCRYQTQKGKRVYRKAGWDTHGLPVELGVEKALGITKEDIGKKISIAEYNQACREAVMRYTGSWNTLTEKLGYWVDLETPYITYQPKYMESLWWLIKELHKKDLLYKGYTVQPYSPAAGTGLSSHELNIPGTYKDVSDTSIIAQFKAIKASLPKIWQNLSGDVYFLAWTTTPWTLPSNTALTVGKDIDYTLVKTYNPYTFEPIYVILADALVDKIFQSNFIQMDDDDDAWLLNPESNKKIPYNRLDSAKGKDLIGAQYEQLLPWAQPYKNADKAFVVIAGNFVSTKDGTGIVHTAPTFGADDALVAKENDVPAMLVLDQAGQAVPLVDLQGRFLKQLPAPFGGMYVKNEYYPPNEAPEKSVDVAIAILLKTQNKAFRVEKYVHSYPHCWRTDKPVLYYPLDSWFIRVTALKQRMIDKNKTIYWKPKATGEGRFGHWLENVNDWNLSRSRYWGVPLPIWRTKDKEETRVIGSLEELIPAIEASIKQGYMKKNPYKDFVLGDLSDENYKHIDLHRPLIDEIVLSSTMGKPMYREPDLIDVWFDSGAMPYAKLHYPFENKEQIDKHKNFPADFIAEGVDQTRGWFYTLHALSCLLFDSVAYKTVVSNGLVLDKQGQKMSKSKGNTVDPFEILDLYGPDATRWYMISNSQPWENLRFDTEGIEETRRKFFGTLYNTYAFFALYANIDGFSYKEEEIPLEERTELDRWILSCLHTLIQEVDAAYADYEPTRATRLIMQFVVDDLSNWYIRLSRRRFWKDAYTNDKKAAYQTLCTCLLNVAKLSAPVAPFFMDKLYQDLVEATKKERHKSVHLAYFPKSENRFIDTPLQKRTSLCQTITSMVFALRKRENIRVRQPLSKLLIPVLDAQQKSEIETFISLIKSEVNVKEVVLLDGDKVKDIIIKKIKPNFKALGPRLGKNIKDIAAPLSTLSNQQIDTFEKQGFLDLTLSDGTNLRLNRDDVVIQTKDIAGWKVITDKGLTLALDVSLNQSLVNEGLARELVNRIQNLRKQEGLEITDKIRLRLSREPAVASAVSQCETYIREETLAETLELMDDLKGGQLTPIDDVDVQILIEKY